MTPAMISPSHSPDHESSAVAFEQAAWWRLQGLTAAEAAEILGLSRKSSWIVVESALRRRWRECIQIKENRDHRSAA